MKLVKSALTLGSIFGVQRLARHLMQYDLDDALGVIGLERRHGPVATTLPAIGLVALGAAVGAGTALALAPYSGKELRLRLSGRVNDAKVRLENAADRAIKHSHTAS